MDERETGRELPPCSRWARRAVLLGSIGAGLWLASSLGHTATARASVLDPSCCPVRVVAALPAVRSEVRTVAQHSVNTGLDPADRPPILRPDPLRPILPPVRTVLVRALPGRGLPVGPLSTRNVIAARAVDPMADRSPGFGESAQLSTTPQPAVRCSICRPDQGNHRSAAHPTPLPAPPGGIPPGGGNAGSSVAAMALLAPANGRCGSPPGLATNSARRTPGPRSRTVTPTSRPG